MSPQAKVSPEEIEELHAQAALDRGWAIREEYNAMLERRKANRSELRNKAAMGVLTPDQQTELDELYPPRAQDEEQAEEAQATAEPTGSPA